jgi:hypothetical protein
MFTVQIGNHDRVYPLKSCFLVNVYDFQGGGFFMYIYAFVMRFATRSDIKIILKTVKIFIVKPNNAY